MAVAHHDVLATHAKRDIKIRTRHRRRAGTIHHQLYVINLLPLHLKGIQQSGTRNNRRPVLVVVHHRNVAFRLQCLLNLEAFRRLDVLKVDSTERRSKRLHYFYEFFRILLVDLYVKTVKPGKNFKQQRFSLHHRLSRLRTDIAQAEHRRAVGNHCYKVALVCIFISILWIFLYLKTRISHARRVSQRQIALRRIRLRRNRLNLARTVTFVIIQSHFFRYIRHNQLYYNLLYLYITLSSKSNRNNHSSIGYKFVTNIRIIFEYDYKLSTHKDYLLHKNIFKNFLTFISVDLTEQF